MNDRFPNKREREALRILMVEQIKREDPRTLEELLDAGCTYKYGETGRIFQEVVNNIQRILEKRNNYE